MTFRFPNISRAREKQRRMEKNQLLIDHMFFFSPAPSPNFLENAVAHEVISQLGFAVTNDTDMVYRSSGMFIAARDFITYPLFGSIQLNNKVGRKNRKRRKQIIFSSRIRSFSFLSFFAFFENFEPCDFSNLIANRPIYFNEYRPSRCLMPNGNTGIFSLK